MELVVKIELSHNKYKEGGVAREQEFSLSVPFEPGDHEGGIKLVEAASALVSLPDIIGSLHESIVSELERQASVEPDEDPAAIGEGRRAPDETDEAHDNQNLAGAEDLV